MPRSVVLALFAVVISGCSGMPFSTVPRIPVAGVDPMAVRDRFAGRIADRFSLIGTILFKYNWRYKMSAIGCVEMDISKREFTVACFNPLGMKLLEATFSEGRVQKRFAIPQFEDRGDAAGAVARDIAIAYLDLVPSAEAVPEIRKREVVFKSESGDSSVWHVFAGEELNLVEKRMYEAGAMTWKVTYFDYVAIDGGIVPGRIVLDSRKYGYRLIVKPKEIGPGAQN